MSYAITFAMKRTVSVGLLGLTLSLSSCFLIPIIIVAAGAVGVYSYSNNTLSRDYGIPYETVWTAINQTAKDCQFHAIDVKKDALTAHLNARRADDSGVTVTAEWRSETVTRVSVRMGTFDGDTNRLSEEAFHRQLAKALGLKE